MILIILSFHNASGQDSTFINQIIEIQDYYGRGMMIYEHPKDHTEAFGKDFDKDLQPTLVHIKELCRSNNDILTKEFLTVPDTLSLKVIYAIHCLHQNPFLKKPKEPYLVVDSILNTELPYSFYLDNYYRKIFTSNTNKNKPFDLSKYNFDPTTYGLVKELDRCIFILKVLEACQKRIIGYISLKKEGFEDRVLDEVSRFPKIEKGFYYEVKELNFDDFQKEVFNDRGPVSYRKHNMYMVYDLLLSHLYCLELKANRESEIKTILDNELFTDLELLRYNKNIEVMDYFLNKYKK